MKSTEPKKKTVLAQASILKRFLAFIADILIINWVILLPFGNIFESLMPTTSFREAFEFVENEAQLNGSLAIVIFFAFAIMMLYFMIFERKLGQTPGKMMFNLYIQSQGKEFKKWQIFVRSIFLIPIFPFMLLWIIDPIAMFFTKENQRLSEVLSKTKVVEEFKI